MTPLLEYHDRPYRGEEDLKPVCDMLDRYSAAGNYSDAISPADLEMYINVPDRDRERDVRIWETPAGRVVGYGMLWIPQDGDVAAGYLYWRVDPDARTGSLGDEIISWAADRMREIGRERDQASDLRSGARDRDDYARAVLEKHGFKVVRYSLEMVRPLHGTPEEPRFPAVYTLRNVNGESDVEDWVEAYNRSFVDHWDFHPMTVENRKHWLTDPAYRPELDLVAVAEDGSFAALCSCEINAEKNERTGRREGLVDLLGTCRGHRHRGLGRAMLLAGLHALKSAGMDVATLGVDAESPTGALRLYESVGFETAVTTIAYRKPL